MSRFKLEIFNKIGGDKMSDDNGDSSIINCPNSLDFVDGDGLIINCPNSLDFVHGDGLIINCHHSLDFVDGEFEGDSSLTNKF